MVDEAVAFAMKAHEGAFRKGTKVPYIVHPLETAVIVSMMSEDEELVCAAILHDVVEDAGVSEQQLETLFGQRVTAFVMEETEDKTKSWKERKAATLKHLETASRESKILVLGDKLSNLRCTARDHMVIGEARNMPGIITVWRNGSGNCQNIRHARSILGCAGRCLGIRE